MSEHSLEEIKKLRRYNGSFYKGITVTRKASEYVDWLISELEKSKTEVKRLHENKNVEMVRRIENCLEIAIDRAENAEAEVRRLKERFADG